MRERAQEQLETDRAMYTERIQEFEDQPQGGCEVEEGEEERQGKRKTSPSSWMKRSLKPILA